MGKTSKDKRDIYYRLAKEQGWRARSAFKLLQIQETFDIFENVKKVADLCAAPGSWSQVLSKHLYEDAVDPGEIKIVAVDLQTMNPIDGVIQLKGDITSVTTSDQVIGYFGGERADLIVCDGAPDVIGLLDIDEYVQHELVISALDISTRLLKPGGTLVAKVFRAKRTSQLMSKLALFFGRLTMAKPKCSRDSSLEAFVVCQDFQFPVDFLAADDIRDYIRKKLSPIVPVELNTRSVPFVVCGKDDAFDSDRTYPLNLEGRTYEHRDPVQPPIHPPYEKAQQMRKDKKLAQVNASQKSGIEMEEEPTGDETYLRDVLQSLQNAPPGSPEDVTKLVSNRNLPVVLERALRSEGDNMEIKVAAAKVTAELAKTETGRGQLLSLLDCLPANLKINNASKDLLISTLRAICNICYENSAACDILLDNGGLLQLITVIKTLIFGKSNRTDAEFTDIASPAISCMCNALHSNEKSQRLALDNGVLDVFAFCLSSRVFRHVSLNLLTCLSIMSDSSENASIMISSALPNVLIQHSLNELDEKESVEITLELLTELASDDIARSSLVRLGIIGKLIALLNLDGEDKRTAERAGNFLVELLSAPKCVEYVSECGLTESVIEAAGLMLSSSTVEKKTVGALIVGNLARTPELCAKIFTSIVFLASQKKIPDLLIDVLLEICKGMWKLSLVKSSSQGMDTMLESSSDDSATAAEVVEMMNLLYAALAALKNLLVPQDVRKLFLDGGYFPPLMCLVDSFGHVPETPTIVPVVSKLLTILCMLCSAFSDTAVGMSRNYSVISQIIRWMTFQDALASREAMRLIAIIQQFTNVQRCFAECRFMSHLIALLDTGSAAQKLNGLDLLKRWDLGFDAEDFRKLGNALIRNLQLETPEQLLTQTLDLVEKLHGFKELRDVLREGHILVRLDLLKAHNSEAVQRRVRSVLSHFEME